MCNQVMQNTTVTQDALATLQELSGENDVPLLKSKLFNRVDYKKSISEGKGVMEYAPSGKAALEVKALYVEIMQLFNKKEEERNAHEEKTKA
jgi:cellulose biosynthesis protein BcsQ